MAQRVVDMSGVGEIIISKRRGSKYLRLSVSPGGKVRISIPPWAPYSAGIGFAKQRQEWIQEQLALKPPIQLIENAAVGKAHRLHFHPARSSADISARLTPTTVDIFSDLPTTHEAVQKKAAEMSEKALSKEAKVLLPQRLAALANKHGFMYRQAVVRKLTSRWGSCSSSGVISLSYYLIQLPWDMIDYVLLHELVHTEHLNHSKDFWRKLILVLPDARSRQKEIKAYNPRIEVG